MEIAMASAKQQRKVERVMHEFKEGELDSSAGKKVTSRKQAVAIALSESGQSRKKTGGTRKTAKSSTRKSKT